MTEHTPGPWAVDHDDRPGMAWNDHIVREADSNHRICFMTSDGNKANARLIAAAPDMLAVLLEMEEYLNDRADVDDGIPDAAMRLLVEVKAAIAKAALPPQQ